MTSAVVPGAAFEQKLEQLISTYADAVQDTFLKAWKHLA